MDKEILELLKTISVKLDEHKQILNEHTQMLRALEHSSETFKSEIDRVNLAIARVEGEVKGFREDLTAVELMTSKNWNDIVKFKSGSSSSGGGFT